MRKRLDQIRGKTGRGGASAALAFAIALAATETAQSQMTACDVVTLTRQADTTIRFGGAAEDYRAALERLGDDPAATNPPELLGTVLVAQQGFLAEAAQTLSAEAYLNSPGCRVIVSLAPNLVRKLRSENLRGPLAAQRSSVIAVVAKLEADLESFLSRARFRSEADRLTASAETLCTAAAVIDAARGEPNRDTDHPLEVYGETVGCDSVNRTGSEWPAP